MTWQSLFERGERTEATVSEIRAEVATQRGTGDESETGGDQTEGDNNRGTAIGDRVELGPERVVADADVLAADLIAGGAARAALDHVRAHDWVVLVASDALLDDATAVIAACSTDGLAADWRNQIERERVAVGHPAGDHPALASALRGGAMHVLTFDQSLQSADAGAAIRGHVETSIKSPDAFASVFDPERLYPAVVAGGGEYPGPDRDPRA